MAAVSQTSKRSFANYRSAIIYISILAIAEYTVTYVRADVGISLHGALIFAMLWHASSLRLKDPVMSKFYGAFAITPLIRILSLSTPLVTFSYINWFTILGSLLVIAIFVIIRIQELKEEDIGLIINWDRAFVDWLVILIAPGFGYLEYIILRPQPIINEISFYNLLAPVIIMVIFTGFVEEVTFRGILQHNAMGAFGTNFALPFVSLSFAILHMGNNSLVYVALAYGIALMYAYTVRFTGSVIGVTIAHGVGNVMLFLVYPLLFNLPLS